MVEAHVSVGTPETGIARLLSIDPKTLRKYYAEVIATARLKANATVAGTLFKEATGYLDTDGKATKKPNIIAQLFWLKTRAGWREKDRDTGPDEGEELGASKLNLKNLTPEQQRELRKLIGLAKKRGAKKAAGGKP